MITHFLLICKNFTDEMEIELMKKKLAVLMTLMCLFGTVFYACDSQETQVTDTDNTEVSTDDTEADADNTEVSTDDTEADADNTESIEPENIVTDPTLQMQIISQQREDWRLDFDGDIVCYAVTDLDQNGRLELISTTTQGTGMYTTTTVWEINETCDALVMCENTVEEGHSQAEISLSVTNGYYDGTDYYYIFNDSLNNGMAESYTTITAVSLNDGKWTENPLATYAIIATEDGTITETYTNYEGAEITADEFVNIPDTYFELSEKITANINWFTSEDTTNWEITEDWTADVIDSLIDASYGSFILE